MSPRAGVTHPITISDVSGTNLFGFLYAPVRGRHPYNLFLAETLRPRVLTMGELTEAEFPPEIALYWPQKKWPGGIGGINYRTHPLMLQDAVMIDSSGLDEVLRLPPRFTQSNKDTSEADPAQFVPCGFAATGEQMWAMLGRRPYRWDFANAAWDAKTIPFDAASHIRNAVAFEGNWYAPRWADDAGSSGSYTGDDLPSIYIYKAAADTQWTGSTLGQDAIVPDAFKYMAVADGKLWGGNAVTITDTTENLAVWNDAVTTDTRTNTASVSFSHTIAAGTGMFLMVSIGALSTDSTLRIPTGVTYNSVAMTQVDSTLTNGNRSITLWRLTAPATGANTVVVTFSGTPGTNSVITAANSFYGVNQTTPLGSSATATGTSTTPSVAVTTVTGDLVYDSVVDNQGDSQNNDPGSGQIERWDEDITGNLSSTGSHEAASGTSTTMSWTIGASAEWAIMGVAIKPGAASGSTTLYTTVTPSSNISVGNIVRLGDEYMLVTAVSDSDPDNLTVIRAQRGTVAAAQGQSKINIYLVTHRPHAIRSTTDGTNTGTWTGETLIGNSSAPITAMLGREDDLIVCKTDGLYRPLSDGRVIEIDPTLRAIAHPDNFRGSIMAGNKAILPLGAGGLLELDFDTWEIRRISPSLMLPNLSAYTGRCIPIAGGPNIFFCLIQESSSTRYHLMKVEWLEIDGVTEWRWHHFYRASYTTGTDVNHAAGLVVGMQGDNDDIHHRLWFGIESTGASATTDTSAMPYWMPVDSTDANYAVHNDTTNPRALTTVYDKHLSHIQGRFQGIRFRTQNLGTGANEHTIQVKYRIDGGTFAFVTGFESSSTLTSDDQILDFSAEVTGRTLELEFLPKFGSSGTGNPEILEFTATTQLRADTVEMIPVRTILRDGQRMLNGAIENRVQGKLLQLRTWRDQPAEVTVNLADVPFGRTLYTCVFLPNQFRQTMIGKQRGRRPEYLVEFVLANVS